MEFAVETEYLFKSIAALAVIILLANVLLKKLHTFSGKQQGAIHVIERIPVSKSSSLAIVKIAKQYYLMSFNDSGSEILKEFTPEEAKEFVESKVKHPASWKKAKSTKLQMNDFRKKYSEAFEKRL